MDPQTAWDQLLSAYADRDCEQINELALALSNWLRKGGFPPTVLGHPAFGPEFEQALAMAACHFFLEDPRRRWTTSEAKGDDP